MLIKKSEASRFDLDEIKRGTLIWAQHESWFSPEMGYVTDASEDQLVVQYPPTTRNVTSHFFVPASEVAAGQWTIRYSNDLLTISKYPEETA